MTRQDSGSTDHRANRRARENEPWNLNPAIDSREDAKDTKKQNLESVKGLTGQVNGMALLTDWKISASLRLCVKAAFFGLEWLPGSWSQPLRWCLSCRPLPAGVAASIRRTTTGYLMMP
jgi:hypothetical protein